MGPGLPTAEGGGSAEGEGSDEIAGTFKGAGCVLCAWAAATCCSSVSSGNSCRLDWAAWHHAATCAVLCALSIWLARSTASAQPPQKTRHESI